MARSHLLIGEHAEVGCHAGEARLRRADTAQRDRVRRCQDWMMGAALSLNGQVEFGATPHIVPGTNAGAVFQPWSISSTSVRVLRTDRGDTCPVLPVRLLPCSGADLQLLRPRSDLLRRRLCAGGSAPCPTRGWQALPNEPPRPCRPCLAGSQLSRPAKKRDASGFPATAAG
jgi:hypothetical protein